MTFAKPLALITLLYFSIAAQQPVHFYNVEKEYRPTQTIIFNPKNASVLELKQIVVDMISQYGSVYVNESSAELYITDVAEKIADITPVLNRLDKPGLLAGENLVTEVITLSNALAQDVRGLVVHKLSQEGLIQNVPYINALAITDIPSKIAEVRRLINTLDVVAKHVAIEVVIVEVNTDAFEQKGLELFSWLQRLQVHTHFGMQRSSTDGQGFQPVVDVSAITPGFFPNLPVSPGEQKAAASPLSFQSRFSLSDIVSFLTENAQGKVLASTRLVTANNKQASLSAGEVIPYQLHSNQAQLQAPIDQIGRTGIQLNVLPHLVDSQTVILKIAPSIASLNGWSPKGAPIIFNRALQTELKALNGQLLAVGGLRREETVVQRSGIPYLENIPLLKYLFSAEKTIALKRDVIIFIRPHIVEEPGIAGSSFEKVGERMLHPDSAKDQGDQPAAVDSVSTPNQ